MVSIDVTDLFNGDDACQFSASRAERGANAGPETWNNAMEEAGERPLIAAEQVPALKEFFQEFGAWEEEEIAAWTDQEVNALAIQYVSQDIREAHSLCTGRGGRFSWRKYERLSQEGTIGGRLFEWSGEPGKIGFSFE